MTRYGWPTSIRFKQGKHGMLAVIVAGKRQGYVSKNFKKQWFYAGNEYRTRDEAVDALLQAKGFMPYGRPNYGQTQRMG